MRHVIAAALLLLVGCVKIEICDNQVDDDGNGRIDCADAESCATDDACAVVCGNDRIDNGEQCDGAQLNGASCFSLGQGNGTLSCNNLCLFDISQCVAGAQCGNGITEVGEECDDNNGSNGDGCDNNCTNTRCGNNIVTAGEQCDDGNTTNGDGCDNNCQFEVGGFCGDGALGAGEQCDDGNNTNGDGCSSTCQNEGAANICTPPLNAALGANSGNTTNGEDLTDGSCQDAAAGGGGGAEVAFSFTPTTSSLTLTLSSASDQGIFVLNACSANGVEIDCVDADVGGVNEVLPLSGLTVGTPIFIFVSAFEAGAEGPFTLTIAAGGGAVCGNGSTEAGEQCDDGNQVNTDACTNVCQNARCGDNIIRAGTETCDDGNTTNGDGCSSVCQIEGGGNNAGLVLNEIDYDNVGSDTAEFIELKNTSNAAIQLNQFEIVLVNGGTDTEYFITGRTDRLPLSLAVNAAGNPVTTLQPGQFLVITTSNVAINANAARIIIQPNGNGNFQNGESASFSATGGDAIGIVNTATGLLVDALSYEGNVTSPLDFTEGTGVGLDNFQFSGSNEATNNTAGSSLERIANTNNAQTDWQVAATPTPGI